jgi:predicted phosphodiesterase
MRGFTTKEGIYVEVTEEHLNRAVEIKKELQNASASRKCNWKLLVDMLDSEGFIGAEHSEGYRCLIKDYQKSIGELPQVDKYADMVIDSKIDSIKKMVGEIYTEKLDNSKVLSDLRKIKKEIAEHLLITEEIANEFKNRDFGDLFTNIELDFQSSTNKKIIMQLADLHVGAKCDNEYNVYNYEVAKQRMAKYIDKIVHECIINDVNEVYVLQTGDEVEHLTMHLSQLYEVEMDLADQITSTSNLIISTLVALANYGIKVKYSGFGGNHSRLSGNKELAMKGDTVTKIINNSIRDFIRLSNNNNIEFIECKPYSHSFTINNVNILALHGDKDNFKDDNILAKHSIKDGIDYDLVIGGHIHTRIVKEVGLNKLVCTSGSLKGADNYSIEDLRKISAPSQNYYIIENKENIEVKWITF